MNALTQPQRYLAAAQGLDPSVQVSTPDYVSQYTQLPEHWEYDINPGSGNSRATYIGEVYCGGQAASNRVATQGDIAAATTGVSSFNTRTGAVALTLADVTGVGGAPVNNTALQGNPTAATQPAGTSNTTLATTAFVTTALANQPGVYTWNGRQGAVTLTLSDVTAAGGAPITSPMFLGTPQAVTAPPGTDNQQLATTAFVMTQMGNSVVSWNGRVGNVTLTLSDVTSVGGAPINAPAFTGVATAVTANPGTATQQLATCQFVTNAVQAATVGVASFNTRTGAVTLQAADISQAGGALLAGPALTGVPTCPTAPAATNTNQIASCAFVETAITGAAVVSSFNTRTGAVTLSNADVANAGALMETGGTMSGPIVLAGNASAALNPVPFQQLTSVTANYMPLAGGTFTGAVTLAGNATGNLQPVTLQQVQAGYVPLAGNVEIVGNIGFGRTLPGPMGPPIAAGAQIIGWLADFINFGVNVYYDGTNYRRSSATAVPIALASTATAFAINGAASGAVDSVATMPNLLLLDSTTGSLSTLGQAVHQVQITVQGSATPQFAIQNTSGTTEAQFYWSSSTGGVAIINNAVTSNIVLDGSGNVSCAPVGGGNFLVQHNIGYQTGGGSWGALSDARIKDVAGEYEQGLAAVLQLRPVVYRYKGNDSLAEGERSMHASAAEAGKTFIGLIAQEAEMAMPEMVGRRTGWIDGQPVDDLRDLNTTALTFALVNAIRELTARVAALEGAILA